MRVRRVGRVRGETKKLHMNKDENYGYRKLIIWKNAREIRQRVYVIARKFPKAEMRRVSQMNDAARSVKQNIQEGYFKSTKGYRQSLVISRGSINELRGDLDDCFEDGLISEKEHKKLDARVAQTDYLITKVINGLGAKIRKIS